VKRAIKSLLGGFGYEIRRAPGGEAYHRDEFADQSRLLGGKASVVLDVGANVGHSVVTYRELFPGATIHAFEPGAEALKELRQRAGSLPNVYVHDLAVGDADTTAVLHTHKGNFNNSLLQSAADSARHAPADLQWAFESTGEQQIRTVRVDTFCRDNGIDRVSVLKLDIQGYEAAALRGASEMLAAGRIDLVYTEVLFAKLYEGQAHFWDLAQALAAHRYELFGLYNVGPDRWPQRKPIGWGDALFLRPGFPL
jgi:FkbM family methyltransferase